MTYHNSTDLKGSELKEATQKAKTQTEKVLDFFKENATRKYTPLMVHRLMELGCPETSTRRAISDLTKEGRLMRTQTKVEEKYGSPNYMWRLNQTPGKQIQLEL